MIDASDSVRFEILPMGDRALLIETTDLDSVLAIDAALRPVLVAGLARPITDLVPAARTVLVVARPGSDLATLRRTLTDALADVPAVAPEPVGREIQIEVRYDGADLDHVATHLGMPVAQVVAAHTAQRWRVAFTGFAPGFGYLVPIAPGPSSATALDTPVASDSQPDLLTLDVPALAVPRRASPRTAVPAGSVALAGEYCGIYPRSSPGGWQLIGTTDAVLWDEHRDPPALLAPGTLVRFIDAGSLAERQGGS